MCTAPGADLCPFLLKFRDSGHSCSTLHFGKQSKQSRAQYQNCFSILCNVDTPRLYWWLCAKFRIVLTKKLPWPEACPTRNVSYTEDNLRLHWFDNLKSTTITILQQNLKKPRMRNVYRAAFLLWWCKRVLRDLHSNIIYHPKDTPATEDIFCTVRRYAFHATFLLLPSNRWFQVYKILL